MTNTPAPQLKLRAPEQMMRLSRLGSFHQCRLSFMRVLLRRMAREKWRFSCPIFKIDEKGVGHAVYTAQGPNHAYSLVAFAHDLPPEMRSDRVIATAWDTTFTLFDGIPTAQDIERLSKNVPLQEAGRVSEKEISVSRANRSVRLWAHFVDSLAAGQQPDIEKVNDVGYLMRTTAVYGSGKLGATDHECISDRPEFSAPFQAEMLSVFLTRNFVRDLVQHMAHAKGGDKTAQLDPKIARKLGIGNSTGLGMAPFLLNHPVLFNNWIMARETAIARVRARKIALADEIETLKTFVKRTVIMVDQWRSQHPIQIAKLAQLKADLQCLVSQLEQHSWDADFAWDQLLVWSEDTLSEEGQELLASVILEPFPELVDDLSDQMSDRNTDGFVIDGAMKLEQMRALIRQSFGWAKDLDWDKPEHCARAWYVSEEKLEPRLGERFDEPIAPYEQPLAPARDAIMALQSMKQYTADQTVAEFLQHHPEHRHTVRRAQLSQHAPYGEIQDNTISESVLPIDMLRAKLSFFGAIHFDPRSDRWVRICMYSGAPYPEELNLENADLWIYPELPQ